MFLKPYCVYERKEYFPLLRRKFLRSVNVNAAPQLRKIRFTRKWNSPLGRPAAPNMRRGRATSVKTGKMYKAGQNYLRWNKLFTLESALILIFGLCNLLKLAETALTSTLKQLWWSNLICTTSPLSPMGVWLSMIHVARARVAHFLSPPETNVRRHSLKEETDRE